MGSQPEQAADPGTPGRVGWHELLARTLAAPKPYRPVPGEPIYQLRFDGQYFMIADRDLSGPLLDLVTAVLAFGEAM